MSYFEDLLTQCLSVNGFPEDEARKAARIALGVIVESELDKVGVVTWETTARIYHLRGQRVVADVIASRMGVTRQHVFKAVRRHRSRLLQVLKLTA